EAEWEFAARGGILSDNNKFSGSKKASECAWFSSEEDKLNSTKPLGGKLPNELGIYDMSGNIWEYCLDSYKKYTENEEVNPVYVSKINNFKVVRGGSWYDSEESCKVTKRYFIDNNKRYNDYGFRVVCEN